MEKRYESDMTRKEKMLKEKEKLKSMGFKDKISYIWTYYKAVFAGLLGLLVLISLGMQIYHNAQLIELLSIGIVDARFDREDNKTLLEENLVEYLGTGDSHETVTIDSSLLSDEEYTSVMKMTVVMGTGSTDILICGGDMYEKYESQEGFLDWKEVLGEDYSKYEEYMTDGKLELTKCKNWEKYDLVYYEPVYAAIVASTQQQENCIKFLELMTQ